MPPISPAMASTDRKFRSLYANPPDFHDLARLDPAFATVIKGRDLDFNDPKSVMQLSKTLLKLDFDLDIELPEDRLCPPVANRHNYILWLKDLVDTSSYNEPGQKLTGLDIGTGASCIYPLLGCTQRPWSFVATDIDAESLKWAANNVKLNNLDHRIQILARGPDDPLIPLDDLPATALTFTMTNPPFYASPEEMLLRAAQKACPPSTACTGAPVEMVTPGGEVTFVERILAESLVLRQRVQWYTSMLGFLSSVTHVIEKLKELDIGNYAVTEFVQGNKTRRWAVAWSFGGMRPAQDVARGTKAAVSKNLLPLVTEVDVLKLPLPESVQAFAENLCAAVAKLDLLSWEWDKEALEGTGRAAGRVWGRAWRRRKKREAEMGEDEDGGGGERSGSGKKAGEKQDEKLKQQQKGKMDVDESVFGFKVVVRVSRDGVSVGCRWMEGLDGAAFESFQGFVKASAQAAVCMV